MILGLLLAFLSVLVIFGGAIRLAQGRARTPASSSDQSHRILIPAFVFTLGITLYALLALVGWAPVMFVILTILSAALINGLGSLIVISGFDLAAKAMDARRTRSWLIAASVVFVGGTALAFLISQGSFSGRWIAALLQPDLYALIMLAAATALIWWSHLPANPADAPSSNRVRLNKRT